MKFKEWWLINESKINKIANFWLLPKKWKIIIRIIASAITAYLNEINNTGMSLNDIHVQDDRIYFKNEHSEYEFLV